MLYQCLIRKSTFKANYFYDLISVRLSKFLTIYVAFIIKKDILFFHHTSYVKSVCHACKYNVNKGFLTILSNVLSTLLMFFPTILYLCFFSLNYVSYTHAQNTCSSIHMMLHILPLKIIHLKMHIFFLLLSNAVVNLVRNS